MAAVFHLHGYSAKSYRSITFDFFLRRRKENRPNNKSCLYVIIFLLGLEYYKIFVSTNGGRNVPGLRLHSTHAIAPFVAAR